MRRRAIGAVLLMLAGLALWSGAGAPPQSPVVERPFSGAVELAAMPQAPKPAGQRLQRGAADEPGFGPGALPHPITDDHRRLYRDADLLHEAQAALAQGDALRARALLAEHAREYPQRDADRDGLLIVADCVARPSPEVRQEAQRFYDEQTASSVRKRLRRTCLETRE